MLDNAVGTFRYLNFGFLNGGFSDDILSCYGPIIDSPIDPLVLQVVDLLYVPNRLMQYGTLIKSYLHWYFNSNYIKFTRKSYVKGNDLPRYRNLSQAHSLLCVPLISNRYTVLPLACKLHAKSFDSQLYIL